MSVKFRFVLGENISSSIIAWAGGGNQLLGWSHVDVVLPDGQLLGARSDRVGGKPAGVYPRPADYTDGKRHLVFELPASKAKEAIFYSFLDAQIGRPYDRMAILAFILNRNWRSPSSWICSELCAAATEKAGLCEPLYLPVNKLSPTTWAVALSALGAMTQ